MPHWLNVGCGSKGSGLQLPGMQATAGWLLASVCERAEAEMRMLAQEHFLRPSASHPC